MAQLKNLKNQLKNDDFLMIRKTTEVANSIVDDLPARVDSSFNFKNKNNIIFLDDYLKNRDENGWIESSNRLPVATDLVYKFKTLKLQKYSENIDDTLVLVGRNPCNQPIN